MAIVQAYKSYCKITPAATGTELVYPVPLGGATLNWNRNWYVPAIAGNFFQMNYRQGLQTPSVDIRFVLLASGSCGSGGTPTLIDANPIKLATLGSWFGLTGGGAERSTDYQHDIDLLTGTSYALEFFDGYTGFRFPRAKANSFTISCAKGEDVMFSCNFNLFAMQSGSGCTDLDLSSAWDGVDGIADATGYTTLKGINYVAGTYPASYTAIAGVPIRFQDVKIVAPATLTGLRRFSVTYSNQLTADLTFEAAKYQSVFPIDLDAGMAVASGMFEFESWYRGSSEQLADLTDFTFQVCVDPGGTPGATNGTRFNILNPLVENRYNRSIGTDRQRLNYSYMALSTDNTSTPVAISAAA